MIVADKGYLSQSVHLYLFNSVNVQLETPKRKKSNCYLVTLGI